jgi:hypothetical protein
VIAHECYTNPCFNIDTINLKLTQNECLTSLTMNAAIQKLNSTFSRYFIQCQIPSTHFWCTKGNFLNPDSLTHSEVYIIHVTNHWVVLTNIHPLYPGQNKWIMFDSLNNTNYLYDKLMCLALRVIAPTSDYFSVDTVQVIPQVGTIDCGLFALAYAQALALDKNPADLQLDQPSLRLHYNENINRAVFRDFPANYFRRYDHIYSTHEVDLTNIEKQ